MIIKKAGKVQVKPSDLIGNKCVCRNEKCGAEGKIDGADVRLIEFRGTFHKPLIKCPNCGSMMEVEK